LGPRRSIFSLWKNPKKKTKKKKKTILEGELIIIKIKKTHSEESQLAPQDQPHGKGLAPRKFELRSELLFQEL
jgi:hypothetical protein